MTATLSVLAFQARETLFLPVAETLKLPGADGAWVSDVGGGGGVGAGDGVGVVLLKVTLPIW